MEKRSYVTILHFQGSYNITIAPITGQTRIYLIERFSSYELSHNLNYSVHYM